MYYIFEIFKQGIFYMLTFYFVLQVLTLSGVARVFNTKRQLLQTLGNFSKAWSLLLEFVETAALSGNNEVSF